MEVLPCTTAIVKAVAYNVKTRVYDLVDKKKYTCPKCNSIEIRIRRGHRDLADSECKSCGNTWWMTFRKNMFPDQIEVAKKDYDIIASYEDQLPF